MDPDRRKSQIVAQEVGFDRHEHSAAQSWRYVVGLSACHKGERSRSTGTVLIPNNRLSTRFAKTVGAAGL
jgi:hypothetical protein